MERGLAVGAESVGRSEAKIAHNDELVHRKGRRARNGRMQTVLAIRYVHGCLTPSRESGSIMVMVHCLGAPRRALGWWRWSLMRLHRG